MSLFPGGELLGGVERARSQIGHALYACSHLRHDLYARVPLRTPFELLLGRDAHASDAVHPVPQKTLGHRLKQRVALRRSRHIV